MENQPKLNSSKEVIAWLAKRFPQCFRAEGEARPLKIGIFQDLVGRVQGEMSLSKTQLRSALRLYTSSWRYLHGVKAGAIRVDLDGNPCGVIDEQHIEHARKQLEEAKARVQAQRGKQLNGKRESGEKEGVHRPPKPVTRKTFESGEDGRKPLRPATERKSTGSKPRKPIADTSTLSAGQSIKVKAGRSAMDATILEVTKDGVRVQLASGLAMIVRAEHLQF